MFYKLLISTIVSNVHFKYEVAKDHRGEEVCSEGMAGEWQRCGFAHRCLSSEPTLSSLALLPHQSCKGTATSTSIF